MNGMELGIVAMLPLALQMAGVFLAVITDNYLRKEYRHIMLANATLIITLLVQNYVGYILDMNGHMIFLRIVTGIYGYCMRPVVILLFCYIVDSRRDYRILWGLVIINALIYLTALFSDICFTIDENNAFHRGPLGYSCHTVSSILLVYLMYITITTYKDARFKELLIPLLNALLIILSVVMDSFTDYRVYPVSYMMMAVVSGALFYFVWLHQQFVREHENALMAQQRIQIMMTQIQPHFLYNTLATIQALCIENPKKAFDITEKFGTYLRQNMDSLNTQGLIPLSKELEHTRIYAEIEMVRFPSVRVEYNIEDDDFGVPMLTIQPLVENAIRHGVRIRKRGLVTVTARRIDGSHEIMISDNGKGFDTDAYEKEKASDGSHIGLANVKERIEKMCHGTFSIESIPDEGTTVTIHIPAKAEKDI